MKPKKGDEQIPHAGEGGKLFSKVNLEGQEEGAMEGERVV